MQIGIHGGHEAHRYNPGLSRREQTSPEKCFPPSENSLAAIWKKHLTVKNKG